MAFTQSPLANTTVKSFAYDNPQYTAHDFEQGTVGVPHVAASGITTGNGAYPIFSAGAPGYVYQATFTITTPGTGATSNVQCYLVSANNGVNVSSNVAIGNLITTGINVAGNVYTTGPFTYNSSTLTAKSGGVAVNVGDTIIAIHTGNTLVCSATTEYTVAPGANVTA